MVVVVVVLVADDVGGGGGAIVDDVVDVVKLALYGTSTSTIRKRSLALRRFRAWCLQASCQPWPIDTAVATRYADALAERAAPSVAGAFVAALHFVGEKFCLKGAKEAARSRAKRTA